MRHGAWSLLVAILVSAFAPAALVVNFQIHRAYVERELCVQRGLQADQRTCHGECHLAKQLRALEEEAERGFPVERNSMRSEPIVHELPSVNCPAPPGSAVRYPEQAASLNGGRPAPSEPVPWC
ncbi:MAG: hypothetical protein ACK4L7_00705 [Flavobacteriales bacterium]